MVSSHRVGAENLNSGPLQEQVLLTTGPFLQTLYCLFFIVTSGQDGISSFNS